MIINTDIKMSIDVELFDKQKEWFLNLPKEYQNDNFQGLLNMLDEITDTIHPINKA